MSASHWKLDNLIAHRRRQQPAGRRALDAGAGFEPLGPKFEAFGWHVQRVNGNDIDALVQAFDAARATTASRSRASSSATPRWPRACRSSRHARRRTFSASSRTSGRD